MVSSVDLAVLLSLLLDLLFEHSSKLLLKDPNPQEKSRSQEKLLPFPHSLEVVWFLIKPSVGSISDVAAFRLAAIIDWMYFFDCCLHIPWICFPLASFSDVWL